MTNLEKFYPGKTLEQFKVEGSPLARVPDDRRYCIDCKECHACDFCNTDLEHKTCIDTFEAWAKMETK